MKNRESIASGPERTADRTDATDKNRTLNH